MFLRVNLTVDYKSNNWKGVFYELFVETLKMPEEEVVENYRNFKKSLEEQGISPDESITFDVLLPVKTNTIFEGAQTPQELMEHPTYKKLLEVVKKYDTKGELNIIKNHEELLGTLHDKNFEQDDIYDDKKDLSSFLGKLSESFNNETKEDAGIEPKAPLYPKTLEEVQEEQSKKEHKEKTPKQLGQVRAMSHTTHYLKWNITDDLSLRYFYSFEDRPELAGKYIIKSHSKRGFDVLNNQSIIASFKDLAKNTPTKEIVGREIKGEYHKTIMTLDLNGGIINIENVIEERK